MSQITAFEFNSVKDRKTFAKRFFKKRVTNYTKISELMLRFYAIAHQGKVEEHQEWLKSLDPSTMDRKEKRRYNSLLIKEKKSRKSKSKSKSKSPEPPEVIEISSDEEEEVTSPRVPCPSPIKQECCPEPVDEHKSSQSPCKDPPPQFIPQPDIRTVVNLMQVYVLKLQEQVGQLQQENKIIKNEYKLLQLECTEQKCHIRNLMNEVDELQKIKEECAHNTKVLKAVNNIL